MRQNENVPQYVKEPLGRRFRRLIFRWIRRAILLVLVAAGLYGFSAYKQIEAVLTGPSVTARNQLALKLLEDDRFSGLPGHFMDPKDLTDLRKESPKPIEETEEKKEHLSVEMEIPPVSSTSEWENYPDGIKIQKIPGETFQAYAMLIKDPSRVYLGLSNEKLSKNTPGKRINEAMKSEGAVAAINSGAFFDNGTSDLVVGATPEGLVFSQP